jgi:two-component system sensor histidine kinase BarA
VSRAAHGLKSMSANIGAAQVKDRAGAIERMARDGDLTRLADAASGLDGLLTRTVSALHLRLDVPTGSAEGEQSEMAHAIGGRREAG